MRAWIVLAALAFGFAASPVAADITSSGAEQQKVTQASAEAALIEAVGRARNNDSRGVARTLAPVIGSPAFAALSEQQRYWGHVLFGGALYDTDDYAGALREYRRATEFRQAAGNDWRMRFWAARGVEDHADAISSIATMSRRWPAALNTIPNRTIFDLQRLIDDLPNRDALLFDMLQALHRARYQPDPFADNSARWRSLVQLLLARSEVDEARRIARDVRWPLAIAEMMIDRRFDPVMEERESVDFAALFNAELERRRSVFTANESLLEGVNALASLLLDLDRGEEALALVDAAIERSRAGRPERFADQDAQLNWTRNHRAYALLSLGRGAEAVEEMRRGARHPEHGRINISQTFNLAVILFELGRSAEALEALGDVDFNQASGYGWMVAHRVLACAHAELGRRAEAEALLAQMRARGGDSRAILRETELCFDHLDEAAALYLQDIEDPDERGRALLQAQTLRTPRHETASDTRIRERWRALLSRPDVRAAVERHGRIISLPVVRAYYGG